MAGQTYRAASAPIASGDILAVYTDGLNETEDSGGEQLGHDTIDRLDGTSCVQRREHPVTGIRHFKCRRNRLSVAHFSNHHDIRVLT